MKNNLAALKGSKAAARDPELTLMEKQYLLAAGESDIAQLHCPESKCFKDIFYEFDRLENCAVWNCAICA